MNKKTKIALAIASVIAVIAILYLIYRQIKLQNSYNARVTADGLAKAIADGPNVVWDLSTDADVQQIIDAANNGGIVHNPDVDDPDFSGLSDADLQSLLGSETPLY